MNAAEIKARLRADLKTAMQARRADDARVLRELIAAVDNAEAVPLTAAETKYRSLAFGDPGAETARLALDSEAIAALLAAEAQARLDAAEEYDRHNRPADAERLRREAAVASSYAGLSLQN
jgi:uncharacterized protein YqeY